MKSANHDALALERLAPDTLVIETAHGGRDLGVQSPRELNDQSFGSAGAQREYDLENARDDGHSETG
jgi:hypothetical protein